jgi:dihydrofolate synthase/folylpolyglutamate synthase
VREHKALIEEIKPSFFEITVVMAFKAFAEGNVDIAIIETGLGGRLDSTNVITPLLSIITNISYDHQDLLGHTLGDIATEKAGIIKPNVPVVIGEQHDETERIFFEHSVHKRSTVYYAQTLWGMVRTGEDGHYQYYKAVHNAHREMYTVKTDLLGNYQQHNIKTVLTAAEVLTRIGFKLTMENVVASLAHVKSATGLRGRWDIVQQHPTIICDVAHNPAGLKEVLKQLESLNSKKQEPNSKAENAYDTSIGKKHIVIGFVKDKDVAEALALFPKDATFYFCNADNPRALPAADLKAMAAQAGLQGKDYPTITAAVTAAKEAMANDDVLLITGSFFIVGDALAMLQTETTIA